ncbi:hypothetical protein [Helicobacter sp. T3_23-1059]
MAIIPNKTLENSQNNNLQKPTTNPKFMELETHSGFVYEGIKDMLLFRQ